ncbi:MAG: potassium channel protein [Oscillatoriales cyanobacterium SM2_2_1]|nr:potassium channel protein [Oscillatoriales cyanobacterium SM2_2_1]
MAAHIGHSRRLLRNIGIFTGILIFGTAGYCWLEGWPWFDALYMTVISLTTVGYGETHPLSPQGRLFTVILLGTGVAGVSYVTAQFIETLTQSYWQTLVQQQRMDSYQQHFILCGFGRTGRQVALEFTAEEIPFVVIDQSAEAIASAGATGLWRSIKVMLPKMPPLKRRALGGP